MKVNHNDESRKKQTNNKIWKILSTAFHKNVNKLSVQNPIIFFVHLFVFVVDEKKWNSKNSNWLGFYRNLFQFVVEIFCCRSRFFLLLLLQARFIREIDWKKIMLVRMRDRKKQAIKATIFFILMVEKPFLNENEIFFIFPMAT